MAITLRATKGSPLTWNELDANFTTLTGGTYQYVTEIDAVDGGSPVDGSFTIEIAKSSKGTNFAGKIETTATSIDLSATSITSISQTGESGERNRNTIVIGDQGGNLLISSKLEGIEGFDGQSIQMSNEAINIYGDTETVIIIANLPLSADTAGQLYIDNGFVKIVPYA